MATRVSLPGMHTPGAGFDQPFELLDACHERVRRSLALLQRLRQYLREQGCDDSARQAACDVLRYFDMAAPLHHQDEELHVFPALLKPPADAQLVALVQQLQADHVRMAACWASARQPLQALADGSAQAFTEPEDAALDAFLACYADHLRNEDERVYPAAQARLSPEQQRTMGADMAGRRDVRTSN